MRLAVSLQNGNFVPENTLNDFFDMKRFFIILLLCRPGYGHAQEVFSIVAHPGENADIEVNISWASSSRGTFVGYVPLKKTRKASDRYSRTIHPQQEELCTTFDSIYSKTADNENFHEYPHFIKCGAVIKGLKKNTEYIFYIYGQRNGKTIALSPLHHFKTAGAREWSATVISDFHSYPPLPGRLKAAMAMVDKTLQYDPSTDWILHLGDVVAWGGSYSFWQRMYEEPLFARYAWAGLNGNHDNMTRQYGQSNRFFRDTNYVPRNGYDGQEGVCYHFRYGDALFIMLNNEAMFKDNDLEKAQQWVRQVVTKARQGKKAPRYIIVGEHYQWFYGNNGKSSQYSRWQQLFDELGIDLALAGNNHIYLRTDKLYGGQVTASADKGTLYLQTSSSDNERGQDMGELTNNNDLIRCRWTEGDRTVSALNMKVTPHHILLTLLDRHGNVCDQAELKPKK